MNILKEVLQPYKIDDELIRLGAQHDGGYILNKKSALAVDLCYTYGVGTDISFEEDLLKLNPHATVHLYDHTLPPPPLSQGMIYHKAGLGGYKEGELDSFFNHVIENNDSLDKKILLKLDAEGAEYNLFNAYPFEHFKNLHAIVLEIHDIHYHSQNFMNIMYGLKQYFTVVHVHANNCGSEFKYQGFRCPFTPEITLVNSSIYPPIEPLFIKYPIKGLDFPNESKRPDFEIDFSS